MAVEFLTRSKAVVGGLETLHGLGLHKLEESFAASAFTDDLAAAGHAHFAGALPKGAIVLGGRVVVTRGMIGDTTAVMTVGDGSVADRYNTSTINVFAAALDGIDFGVPSGVRYHAAAVTPVVTVTGGSNFTSVLGASPNGQITVAIFYMSTAD